MSSPLPRVIASAFAGIVLLALALYLRNNDPEGSTAKFPPCIIKKTTGLLCPGCGTTRSAYALLNFDIARAWRKNPAFVILLPFIVGGFGIPWFNWTFPNHEINTRFLARHIPYWVPLVVLGLLITYGILRNIPSEPFSLLAPR